MKLVTSAQMREMDRRTIEEIGVPGAILMDRASRGAVQAFLDFFQPPKGASIGLLCGSGNNGGDGLAMAAIFHHLHFSPFLILLDAPDQLSEDTSTFYRIASRLFPESIRIADDEESLHNALQESPECSFWCDALLGTGLDRPLGGRYARAVEFLNDQPSPVFAVDIPTGIHADTGQILGLAAQADGTASFGLRKLGLTLDPARSQAGRIYDVDIQIPRAIQDQVGVAAEGLNIDWLRRHLSPRPRDTHKGLAGRTLHVGGRPPTTGAIHLSARAALVGGAGLITVALGSNSDHPRTQLPPEVMAASIFQEDQESLELEALQELSTSADVVVLGPGLKTDALAAKAFRAILDAPPKALILDADALNLLSKVPDLAAKLARIIPPERLVLTPHPGEMARLQGCNVEEILANPVSAAQELAKRLNAVVVLKTAATVIASPGDELAINLTGNPGMATGGMGDALTGLIAAAFADFPGQGFSAAAAGVVLHGAAGDLARKTSGDRGLTVTALLDAVPPLWESLGL